MLGRFRVHECHHNLRGKKKTWKYMEPVRPFALFICDHLPYHIPVVYEFTSRVQKLITYSGSLWASRRTMAGIKVLMCHLSQPGAVAEPVQRQSKSSDIFGSGKVHALPRAPKRCLAMWASCRTLFSAMQIKVMRQGLAQMASMTVTFCSARANAGSSPMLSGPWSVGSKSDKQNPMWVCAPFSDTSISLPQW